MSDEHDDRVHDGASKPKLQLKDFKDGKFPRPHAVRLNLNDDEVRAARAEIANTPTLHVRPDQIRGQVPHPNTSLNPGLNPGLRDHRPRIDTPHTTTSNQQPEQPNPEQS